jgi:peptidoglycan/LPS O-acetylase OafA/YrhL
MTGASGKTEARVTELDGLRGVLAWTVVASHILLVSGWYDPLVRRFEVLGDVPESAVDVFMILSGFAITHVLILRPRLDTYVVRRACRIIPAYYVALTLGILFNNMAADNLRRLPPGTIGAGYVPIFEVGDARMWLDAPLHFLFLHGLIPTTLLPALPYTLLGVAWSLSLEFQFYVIAPALIGLCRRWRWILGLVIVAVLVATLFAGKMMALFSNAFLPAKALFFLVGALSYFALERRGSGVRAWILCLSLNTALCAFWWFGTGRHYEALLGPFIWAVMIVAIRFNYLGPLRTFLNSRPLQFLGRISYSTYLFHAPVIFLLQAAIWRWLNPSSTRGLLFWTTSIGIPAIFLVSWLSWRGIEQPFQRLGRRYAHGKPG